MSQEENELSVIPTEPSLDDLAFIAAYFEENMNGTRAYMKLHPNSGYHASRSSAATVLAKPSIRAEISRILNERVMSAEEALVRVGDIARADHKPFIRVDTDGFVYFNFADSEAQANMHLIKKIKTKRERRIEGFGKAVEEWEGEWVEVELHDAYAALQDILKMHGKFGRLNGGSSDPSDSELRQLLRGLLEAVNSRDSADIVDVEPKE